MTIQLDNIHFYQALSLPKHPQTTTFAATWKSAPSSASASACAAVAAQPLRHMFSPNPPAPSGPTAPAPGVSVIQFFLVSEKASQQETVTPRNVFDIELEKIYKTENTPSMDKTGVERDCSYVSFYSVFPDLCQDLKTPHAGKRGAEHTCTLG